MKKFVIAILCATIMVLAASCGAEITHSATPTPTKTVQPTETPNEVQLTKAPEEIVVDSYEENGEETHRIVTGEQYVVVTDGSESTMHLASRVRYDKDVVMVSTDCCMTIVSCSYDDITAYDAEPDDTKYTKKCEK